MTVDSTAGLPGELPVQDQTLTDRVIETAWLAGVIAAPLAFTPRRWLTFYNDPKYFVLHLLALAIVIAWTLEWALARRTAGAPLFRLQSPSGWAARRPERWAIIAAGAFALVAVGSTVLSPEPRVSLWGRDPIGLGYELYSFLALLTLFFAVALRLRSVDQARWALLAITIAGGTAATYGIAQRLGFDPLGRGEDFARVYASMGNPIFFGSFLVIASLSTLAIGLDAVRAGRYRTSAVVVVALVLELTALWFTGSRGPWLGFAAGALSFAGVGAIWLHRRTFVNGLAMLVIGVVLAILLVIALPNRSGQESARDLSTIGNIFSADDATSIGARTTTWAGALELARDWDRSPPDGDARRALRPLFGLGPDMYYYSYPLSIDVDPSGTGLFFAHTHNYLLQVLLELGYLGLAVFLTLGLLTAYSLAQVLRSEKAAGRADGRLAIFAAVLLALLVGRAVEQMSGVAHVGDLAPFWVLMGLSVALARISASREDAPTAAAPARGSTRSRNRPSPVAAVGVFPIAVAVVVVVAGLALFFVRDVRGIGASRLGAEGFNLIRDGQINEGLARYQRAAELMPDVELYALQVDFVFRVEADARTVRAEKIDLNEQALELLRRYEDRDPEAHATQRRMARAELALARLGQTERFDDVVARYERLAAALRSFPTTQALAADGIVAAGRPELGLVYADRAIAMGGKAITMSRAWWVRGVAQSQLGRTEDAIASLETAIEQQPDSIYATEAHGKLADIFEMAGDFKRANEERARAAAAEDGS